jgi:hypothetical protein
VFWCTRYLTALTDYFDIEKKPSLTGVFPHLRLQRCMKATNTQPIKTPASFALKTVFFTTALEMIVTKAFAHLGALFQDACG